jgi:hypothetical protein
VSVGETDYYLERRCAVVLAATTLAARIGKTLSGDVILLADKLRTGANRTLRGAAPRTG